MNELGSERNPDRGWTGSFCLRDKTKTVCLGVLLSKIGVIIARHSDIHGTGINERRGGGG